MVSPQNRVKEFPNECLTVTNWSSGEKCSVGATVISSLREGLLPSKKLVRRETEFFTSGLYRGINHATVQ